MEIPDGRELNAHRAKLEAILRDVCLLPKGVRFIEVSSEGEHLVIRVIRSGGLSIHHQRQALSELSNPEPVLALPLPNAANPRFWIGVHEAWSYTHRGKRARFASCGLRLYVGADEILQVLRLEWTAQHTDGTYAGDSAGHPHWHVDTAGLLRRTENQRAQALLEAHLEPTEVEPFVPEVALSRAVSAQDDYAWLGRLHLAANAGWMGKQWDGIERPGPHQCHPLNLRALDYWWEGAIRYIESEVRRRSGRHH